MRDWNTIIRKVLTRQYAIDNSWKGNSRENSDCTADEKSSSLWMQLEENLVDANSYKYIERNAPIVTHKKYVGPIIVFCKKAVRKILHKLLGWYFFPLCDRQSNYNDKILRAVTVESELLSDCVSRMDTLEQMISKQRDAIDAQQKIIWEQKMLIDNLRIFHTEHQNACVNFDQSKSY